VDGGENGWWLRLSKSVFFKNFTSCDISQTGIDIEDPSDDNVQDMEENNISKYRSNPMVEGGVIAVGISAINMSSLCLLNSLVPSFLSCFLLISS
jgi:hypothetical protein